MSDDGDTCDAFVPFDRRDERELLKSLGPPLQALPDNLRQALQYLKERKEFTDINSDEFRRGFQSAITELEFFMHYHQTDETINDAINEAYAQGIEDANRMRNTWLN